MKDQEYIEVPVSWLERLDFLATQANNEVKGGDERTDLESALLIGYASSAKTLLTLLPRIKK